ncbi:YrhB domain-containing protein [Chitinophaga varians]|uniref:YrhB domain-containing protein n=1 Tax=Chitinophaga varians TaxID=2202339 RepID=UPI00165FAD0F|nr:YrhB domain-containing protein [Chitinophaga varians]MBC9914086.1 hypothetical protein [Chitinophaga varians]
MITKEMAIEKVEIHLKEMSLQSLYTFVLLYDYIVAFEYGWVFSYQNKTYIETGNVFDKLGGNAPLIVNKFDGSITVTGTAHRKEYYIDEYVKKQKRKENSDKRITR